MELTLIYGREGSGKSGLIHRVCNEKRKCSKIIVLVPDQYTHQTELDLISAYNSAGLIDTEVLSFKRLSHRLKLIYGGASVTVLSEEGKTMLINRIINSSDFAKENTVLGNTSKTDICHDIAKLISRFKQYSITPEMLEECAVDGEKYAHTKAKLSEMALIYKAYTQLRFEENGQIFLDEEDDAELLQRNIVNSGFFADTEVFLDGFDDFAKTELAIIEALINASKSVTISLPADCVVANGRRMLFKRQIGMIRDIEELAAKCNVKPKKIWLTDKSDISLEGVEIKETKERRKEAISHIERNIFAQKPENFCGNADSVQIVKENNIESEAEHTADKIVSLVRDNGYRYNEIAVVCSDIQKYKRFVTDSFSRRNIPLFMDIKRSIKDNALIRFIIALLDVAVRKRTADSVISFLKTGLITNRFNETGLPFSYSDIAYIEKYCSQYYIKPNDWKCDFRYGGKYYDLERLNSIRERVMYYILPFEEALSKAHTALDISKAIENYLSELKIQDIVNENIEYLRENGRNDIALEYSNIWNVINSLLSQINMFMGSVEMSADDFLSSFKGSVENITVNVIPACVDQVLVCGAGRTMAKHIRALFVLGAGSISSGDECGVFSQAELDMLKARNIDIGADSENVICDEEYYIYKILSKPTDLLYISSTNGTDSLGENTNPVLLNAVKNIFGETVPEYRNHPVPYALGEADNIGSVQSAMLFEMTTLNEKTEAYYKLDEWLKNNGDFKYGVLSKIAEQGKNYTLTTERAGEGSLIKQSNGEYVMDISRLEKYVRCPYAYFVRYCLNPKPDVYGKVSAVDVGNIVHEALDKFTRTVMRKDEPSARDAVDFMRDNFDTIVQSYETGKFNATPENKYVLQRTRNFLIKMMTVMTEHKCSSSTVLFAAELPFGDNRASGMSLPAVECFSQDGIKFKITGKIDCAEYYTSEHGRYWIVSDYKTGRNPSNTDIIKGRSLQLPIYMFAVMTNDKDSKPGAMFYVNVNDDLMKPDGENTESCVKRKYGRVGIVAENDELYKGIDRKCKNESKNVYDIKSSDTVADSKKLETVEEERLNDIVMDAVKTAGDIFCDIKNGYIVKSPASGSECAYCEYRRLCGYDSKLKNVDERKHISKEAEEKEV